MVRAPRSPTDEEVRRQAAAWFARLRAPDGEGDRPGFEAWRAADPQHADVYDRLVRHWEQTAFLASTPTGRSRQLRHAAPRIRWRRSVAAAAVAAMLLILVPLGQRAIDGPGPTSLEADYASAVGELRWVELADGSRVTLDTATRLHAGYSVGERRLQLRQGRARFDVAHEARPFIVEAPGALVIAHGTVFDVAVETGGVVKVALLSGSVEVRQPSAPRPGAARMLAPGQAVTVAARRTINAPAPLAAGETQWTSGMLSFEGTRLDEAVTAINRYARRPIRIGDPDIASLRVTGAFRAADTRAFAEAVAAAFGLRLAEQTDGGLLIARQARPPR